MSKSTTTEASLLKRQRQERVRQQDRAAWIQNPSLGFLRRPYQRGEAPVPVPRVVDEVWVFPLRDTRTDQPIPAVRRVCASCPCADNWQPHNHGPLPCWLEIDRQEGEAEGYTLPLPDWAPNSGKKRAAARKGVR